MLDPNTGIKLGEEVDQLRAENEKLTTQARSYAALVKSMEETKSILLRKIQNMYEAVATLESEREANKELTEELTEQARLLGISAGKELTLLSKIERLKAELAATIKERNAFQDQCIRLEQKRALEKFELEEVKQDAERYRWLRNKVAVLNDGFFTVLLPTAGCEITEDDKVETDAAIDEAMKGK